MKHILTYDIDSDLLGDLEHQDVLMGALQTGLLKNSPSTEKKKKASANSLKGGQAAFLHRI